MSSARELSMLPVNRPCSASPIPLARWKAALVRRVQPGGLASREPAPCPAGGERYTLLHKLGEGGMGEIWCAEDAGRRGRVALKFLKLHLEDDPVACRRFLREGRIAASTTHPGLVEMFDVVEQAGRRPFLVMQLLDGRTLAEVVGSGDPLEPYRAVRLLTMLAETLAYLHAKRIRHRDVKPANIMLVDGTDEGGRTEAGGEMCKLIDFGLADGPCESVSVTRTGDLLGSPAYMSPEQFRGEPVGPRSDIYSLGCVAHFVLAGVRPFQGRTPAEVMYQHLCAPVPTLPRLRAPSTMQRKLQAVLNKACHKQTARRFSSARALAEALVDAAGEHDRGRRRRMRPLVRRAKAWASVAIGRGC